MSESDDLMPVVEYSFNSVMDALEASRVRDIHDAKAYREAQAKVVGYVWAYEKVGYWRVISPYMGDTHATLDEARRWYADEYDADSPDYLGLKLYRLVPVEADPPPALSFTEQEADRNARGGSGCVDCQSSTCQCDGTDAW